jgi:cell shape-determining protein MreC
MSYLLDKRIQRKRFIKIALSVVVLIILIYFRSSVGGGLSYVSQGIFRPVLILGQGVGNKLSNIKSYFFSKKSLFLENENLKAQISESEADRANYSSVVAENENLKEILGRKNINKNIILAAILSKPNQSLYDTLVIDVGTEKGVKIGDTAFAFGNIPIGRIAEIYPNSSKVILFSNAGEKTQAIMSGKNVFMELVGRGGGNFEMILPRDTILQKGDLVTMPGINPYVIAIVETVISDPRDPFTKVLLTCPINIQELKFVEVEQWL